LKPDAQISMAAKDNSKKNKLNEVGKKSQKLLSQKTQVKFN